MYVKEKSNRSEAQTINTSPGLVPFGDTGWKREGESAPREVVEHGPPETSVDPPRHPLGASRLFCLHEGFTRAEWGGTPNKQNEK